MMSFILIPHPMMDFVAGMETFSSKLNIQQFFEFPKLLQKLVPKPYETHLYFHF
jgi:hypothetical protein